ncbi:DnaB-like helicase N-terminal domain-containing protein [Akkermansia sp. JRP_AM1]|uniref:DnaB-like helicase N-terminal domain-containing protein n=1 Tax=Akkermansia sp. JRP_AM1 TaxID=3414159 RepID=UPI003BFA6D74
MDPATYMPQAVTFGVTEDFFYIPAHQLLWRLFLARYNANLPLDIISITQALADMRQLDAVGGAQAWRTFTRSPPPGPILSIISAPCAISPSCGPLLTLPPSP